MKKGISLASVIIVTFLILFLITTVTISINKVSENAKKISFATELNSLQTSVDSYYLVNNQYPILGETIILDISNLKDTEIFSEEDILNNKVILNKIDYDKINYTSLNNDDVYGVSDKTGKVYSSEGLKIGSDTYYTLTEDLKILISEGRDSSIKNNVSVVFIPSEVGWTNNQVKVKVKVPKEYSNISVFAGIDKYSLSTTDETYYVYTVEKDGNYTIEVNYLDEKKIEREAKYIVKNYDIEKPIIQIDEHVVLSEEQTSDIYGYYLINNYYDNESGVKQIKCEYGRIEDNVYNYFKSNGDLVKDDRIMIKRGYEYITVYIEDNATNYNVVYIKI